MGHRLKQRILNRRISNGQDIPKVVFNILSYQGNTNQNDSEILNVTPVRMAKIKIANKSLCWRGCGVRRTLLLWWWKCKLLQSVWKSIWQFLRKLAISLSQNPVISLLGIYSNDAQPYHKDTCSTLFIVALFIIVRTWKKPR